MASPIDLRTLNTEDAREFIQTADTEILAMAASGELDLNALARQELASRGLDWQGKWVGFDRAASIAKLHPVRHQNGRIIAVSVPE